MTTTHSDPRKSDPHKSDPHKSTPAKKTQHGDAISLLEADHRAVEKLFAEFEAVKSRDGKSQVASRICDELTVHAELEEQGFYPVARKALGKDADLIDEASVEHASLKWLIEQIQEKSTPSALFEARVTVLKEYVNHHVREEEKELFPKLKKTDLDLQELGENLQALKADLQKDVTKSSRQH